MSGRRWFLFWVLGRMCSVVKGKDPVTDEVQVMTTAGGLGCPKSGLHEKGDWVDIKLSATSEHIFIFVGGSCWSKKWQQS
jgi:hypothetical protein|mmetsp:Transcript_8029/g.11300  ORF Transcript_8029/g.11300 Transcript_8029/m.11300 type:complete len:80 (-) Transcript_8029:590-829(-)